MHPHLIQPKLDFYFLFHAAWPTKLDSFKAFIYSRLYLPNEVI